MQALRLSTPTIGFDSVAGRGNPDGLPPRKTFLDRKPNVAADISPACLLYSSHRIRCRRRTGKMSTESPAPSQLSWPNSFLATTPNESTHAPANPVLPDPITSPELQPMDIIRQSPSWVRLTFPRDQSETRALLLSACDYRIRCRRPHGEAHLTSAGNRRRDDYIPSLPPVIGFGVVAGREPLTESPASSWLG